MLMMFFLGRPPPPQQSGVQSLEVQEGLPQPLRKCAAPSAAEVPRSQPSATLAELARSSSRPSRPSASLALAEVPCSRPPAHKVPIAETLAETLARCQSPTAAPGFQEERRGARPRSCQAVEGPNAAMAHGSR